MLAAFTASGSPARKGVFLMYQPDGTSFKARLSGDEYSRVLTTADGCAVTKGTDGFYQFAEFSADGSRRATGHRVGKEAPQSVISASRNIPYSALAAKASTARRGMALAAEKKRGTAGWEQYATRGSVPEKKHCLVILAQFRDLEFQNPETRRSDFVRLISSSGTNSVADYLDDQFLGSCSFDFTVSEIVTVSKGYAYYGKNRDDKAGEDSNPRELVKEACRLVDDETDFSQFDDDGDGIVDNLFVIVAGKSEAEGADADCIWPHSWQVEDGLVLDGKKVSGYAMSTELTVSGQSSSGRIVWGLATIGAFCHEYSHTLGLSDVYDTDQEGSGGVSDALWGSTSLMDSGNYNDNGNTPPNYNALDRYQLGTGMQEELTEGTCELEPIDENGRYLIQRNPNDENEFFLFECRKQNGWDAFIGGSGLVVYHVDMSNRDAGRSDQAGGNVTAWYRWVYNEINCNPQHQCADLVEPLDKAMDVSQVFFPYKDRTSFTVSTDPAFVFNDGTESPLSISSISRSGSKVRFTVHDSGEVMPSVTGLKQEVYQDAAILTWESDISEYDGEAEVTWGETSGKTETVTVKAFEPGRYSLTLEGLTPTKAYSATVRFRKGDLTGDAVECDFLTKSYKSGNRPFIYLEHLSAVRRDGRFPSGTGLPLRVHNAPGAKVDWYYDGTKVTAGASGYFTVTESGTLKAAVTRVDGTEVTLIKEITVL